MNVQRCPECGQRLNSNYCDICMRKVPFGGVKLAKYRDPWDSRDGSSAHRKEKDHECISFDYEKKSAQQKKTTFVKPGRKYNAPNKKVASVVAIVLAVFSVLPVLFGIVEEVVDSVPVPEPEYFVAEDFVVAGDPGAEDVPAVIAGEIYNDNGICITVDDAGLSYGEYTVLLTVYNNTDDKISVSFDNVSINGFMISYGTYQQVKAGESRQLSMTFDTEDLEKAGITQVSEIVFELYAYEEKDFEDIVAGDLVTVRTEAENVPLLAVDTSGLEIYNDGRTRVVLQTVAMDDYGDCEMDLYMENLSDRTVNLYCGEVAVNGEEVSGYVWKTLRPDTRAFDTAYIYELDERVDLDIEDLSQIEEISIDLYIEYTQGYDILDSFSEKVTFDPNAIA